MNQLGKFAFLFGDIFFPLLAILIFVLKYKKTVKELNYVTIFLIAFIAVFYSWPDYLAQEWKAYLYCDDKILGRFLGIPYELFLFNFVVGFGATFAAAIFKKRVDKKQKLF